MNEELRSLEELFQADDFPPDAFFLDKAFQGRKIVVYGAGESFHYYKEVVMRRHGIMPHVVLDRRFTPGDHFEGTPAFPPHAYHPSPEEQQEGVVVVCLGQQPYYEEVVNVLREMGFARIIGLRDIYEIHNPFQSPAELESDGFRFYLRQREAIQAAMALWADEEGRTVYLRCLQTHLRRKPVPIPMRPREEQYTPTGVPLAKGYDRFLYCGVSVGELASICRRVGRIRELVCFEPDPNQYRLASEYLRQHHLEIADRVSVWPCAVYHRDSLEPFAFSDTSFGSRLLVGGGTKAQCVAIDHVLPGFCPTFVSMDIEGAELPALRGAESVLREHRPDLAICVYHSPDQLWEIPHYLNGLGLGYRFFLRNYTSLVGETVLYATTG